MILPLIIMTLVTGFYPNLFLDYLYTEVYTLLFLF
jgi:NADH:ubiquinone oxidoreductase subunit 4 (subunit M)